MIHLSPVGGKKIDNMCLLIHRFVKKHSHGGVVFLNVFLGFVDLNIAALLCCLVKHISCLTLR